MPSALTRQHSTHKSTKRPESPIKRSSSARLSHSGRSPSPFSPNTSHNEMPTPTLSSSIDSKPATVRRRSARLSSATPNVSQKTPSTITNGVIPNGNKSSSAFSRTISLNGVEELEEQPNGHHDAWSHAVPNGHPVQPQADDLKPVQEPIITRLVVPEASEPLGKEVVRPPIAPAKPKIDWEIPRKTLHSSIGVIVLALYTLSFTIPPIIAVLSLLLVSIALLDFVRLRNPRFEAFYEKSVGFLMRESEKQKVNGTVWYLIGVIFVLSFYPADVAIVSILILSWADTAASTIGRAYGRYTPPLPRRIPYIGLRFAPRKSTAGYSAAFVTGGVIAAAFLSSHCGVGPSSPRAVLPPWKELKGVEWKAFWDTVIPVVQGYTNFSAVPVEQLPSSWSWSQRVGGGWPGLVVLGLWSGFVTAVSEAIDLGETDDNLTLPVLSGLGIWAYIGLLNWIDRRML